MEILRGIPVSHGVALGPALVLDAEGFRIPQQHVPPEQVEVEIGRDFSLAERRSKLAAAGEGGGTQQGHGRQVRRQVRRYLRRSRFPV